MKWVKVYDHSIEREADFVHRVNADGKRICLVKNGPDFFATQVHCPHAGADLSYGWCQEGKLVCPYHRHMFDLKTGSGDEGQGDYLKTYPVEVRPDGVYIGLKESWLKRLFR
jgi:nitrite reductase/ring-hydroxylating ferredoxin subunit